MFFNAFSIDLTNVWELKSFETEFEGNHDEESPTEVETTLAPQNIASLVTNGPPSLLLVSKTKSAHWNF